MPRKRDPNAPRRPRGQPPKGATMDEVQLAEYASQGLPDKALATLMDCDAALFGKWPHLRKIIDKERAKLQLTLASTFVAAAKGTPAKPPTAPDAKDGEPAIAPDMKAGDTLLQRLGFFDEPLDKEVVVRVVYDEDVEPDTDDAPNVAPREPVNIKKIVASAVATITATQIAVAGNGNGNGNGNGKHRGYAQ